MQCAKSAYKNGTQMLISMCRRNYKKEGKSYLQWDYILFLYVPVCQTVFGD